MVLAEKTYTADEFFELAALPENRARRLELEDGEIIEMAPSSPLNTVIAMCMGHFLNAFVIPRDLGYITGPDGGFKVGEKRVRQPDVAFISKARVPRLPRRFNLAPDLAVEVVSPDEDVLKKATEYFAAGTRLVWAVYAETREVYAFTPPTEGELRARVLKAGDILDGGNVLPGFSVAVNDLFPAE